MPTDRQSGFTLIELMIVIALVAILAALALPSFQQSLRSNRAATATNEMIGALSLARSEAIRNNGGAAICASTDGATCTGGWSDGWLVWADTDGNGTLDAGEAVLRYSQGKSKLTVSNAGGTVAFDSRGRRVAVASQTLTIRPDECGGQPLQRTLTINASGQITTAKGACL